MTKLRHCPNFHYTLKSVCPNCKKETQDAHYKFLKLRDVKENQSQQNL
ncbi:MAG: nucleolar RNA-binding Nop10p family protein [Nanoarchaeota archaeon]